jgi:hypothetical protein
MPIMTSPEALAGAEAGALEAGTLGAALAAGEAPAVEHATTRLAVRRSMAIVRRAGIWSPP